jgi:hypothetical protein
MLLTFALSMVFSIGYCVYWLLGWFGIQVGNKPLKFELNSYGKVASLVYILLAVLINIIVLVYFCYLQSTHNLSKQETIKTMLRKHKRVFLCSEILSLVLAFTVLVSIAHLGIGEEEDYIMVHSMMLCCSSYVRIYKAGKLFGAFDRHLCLQLGYFCLLAGFICYLLGLDIHLERTNNCLIKDDISSNLALILEMLFMELSLAKEKKPLQVVLKLMIYAGIARGIWLLSTEIIFNSHSLEFAYSIAFNCLLSIVILKDAILLAIMIKSKFNDYKRRKILHRRRILLEEFILDRRNQQRNSTSAMQLESTECAICLDSLVEA